MPMTTWCPFCSKPNLYEMSKPRYCGSCSKDMTTAFQTTPLTAPKPPLMTTVAHEEPRYAPEPLAPPAPLRRPKPLYGSYEDAERGGQPDDTDEHYSRDQVNRRASQLSQAFAGAFNFSVDPGVTLKAGSILAPVQAQAEQGSQAPRKTRAKKIK